MGGESCVHTLPSSLTRASSCHDSQGLVRLTTSAPLAYLYPASGVESCKEQRKYNVAFQPGQSGNPAGRPRGSRNQRVIDGEAYARAIVEDPEVRAQLLKQAQQGILPYVLMQMFFAYAYGKPVEVVDVGNGDSPTRTIQISF